MDSSINPFAQSVETQIAALRRANDEEGWGIPVEDINRLVETAPEWPEGRLAFRSLRIRFGEGDEGVALTFWRHNKRIFSVFRVGFEIWNGSYPLRYEGNLRLLVGNHTHNPTVEWVIIDLDVNQRRESIAAVRGPNSLADELFVFAWMFPGYISSIWLHLDILGLFAAGYEVNEGGRLGGPWQYVPLVDGDHSYRKISLDSRLHSDRAQNYFVPILKG